MNEVSEELAEFVGIVVGDGYVQHSVEKHTYRVIIAGHSEDDFMYLTQHTNKLIKKLFDLRSTFWKQKNKKSLKLAVHSKEVVNLLLSLGLPNGEKSIKVKIPSLIFNSKNLKVKAGFLRGLADTDFSVVFKKGSSRRNYTYPIITATFASKKLVKGIKLLLSNFSIKANIYPRKRHGSVRTHYDIHVYGKENLERWIKHVGFNNEKHLTKIKIWRKLGFCPPHTSLRERILILKG